MVLTKFEKKLSNALGITLTMMRFLKTLKPQSCLLCLIYYTKGFIFFYPLLDVLLKIL